MQTIRIRWFLVAMRPRVVRFIVPSCDVHIIFQLLDGIIFLSLRSEKDLFDLDLTILYSYAASN
uniref:Uncharacterized protein n=1 Tax=Arundo donax TaxID=35708 RepID=A0A0A9HW52_ARUDO